jgi:predicted DsbA family dithiol-disulfide isomerase
VQRLEASSVISARARDEYSSRSLFEECLWRTRCAFFRHGQDIGQLQTLLGVAESLDLPVDRVSELIQNGEAMAELFRDVALKDRLHIEGSPTYVLNEGRQKLYGNVGYRTIEANVRELMQDPGDHASWC